MDSSTIIITILTAIIATATWINVVLVKRLTKETNQFQAMSDIFSEYRKPEMKYAVNVLWNFYRDECKSKKDLLIENYNKVREQDKEKEKNIDIKERFIFAKNTLDYQRRLLSLFYLHFAVLNKKKIITDDFAFNTWHLRDLEIIPEVLFPMELRLAELYRYGLNEKWEPLQMFYRAKEYYSLGETR